MAVDTWLIFLSALAALLIYLLDIVVHHSVLGVKLYVSLKTSGLARLTQFALQSYSTILDMLLGSRLVSIRSVLVSIVLFVISSVALFFTTILLFFEYFTEEVGAAPLAEHPRRWIFILTFCGVALVFDCLSIVLTRIIIRKASYTRRLYLWITIDLASLLLLHYSKVYLTVAFAFPIVYLDKSLMGLYRPSDDHIWMPVSEVARNLFFGYFQAPGRILADLSQLSTSEVGIVRGLTLLLALGGSILLISLGYIVIFTLFTTISLSLLPFRSSLAEFLAAAEKVSAGMMSALASIFLALTVALEFAPF